MVAAQDLFARHGVEGVSLRTINAAAGVSPGVLHYHFGHRDVLVTELILARMPMLMERRAHLLEPLQNTTAQPDVNALCASLVQPLAELAAAEPDAGRRYIRFIARLYSDRSQLLRDTSTRFERINSLYLPLLGRALPDLKPAELSLRLAMANHSMLQTLNDLCQPDHHWRTQDPKNELKQAAASLVAFMAAGIRG